MKKTILKKSLVLATSALTLSTAFVGCTDYNTFTEGELKQVQYNQKYDEAFIKQFGQPDPNHDWGMDEHIGVIEAFSLPVTRVGHVVVERNMWTMFDSKTSKTFPTYNDNAPTRPVEVPNYKNEALGRNIQIPGYPHLNGLYYVAEGNVLHKDGPFTTPTSGQIPAGDVTPYEIQYVSNWFRTHKNPTSNIHLHLSDFFIQNVSCDKDQVNYYENSDPKVSVYKTGWPNTGNNGSNIETVDQARAHKSYNGGDYISSAVNENIDYYLDQLGFLDMGGEWTHVNNFNSGNSNFDPENKASNPNRMIMYVKSSGTESFRCHPSWSTNKQWINDYVLVKLTWVETVKDANSPYPKGTKIPREGYYLGFDFSADKGDGKVVNRDGYYSNWIVKITPGHFAPTGNSKRIMCEDLGGSFDFDFNDAVVDVAFEGSSAPYTPIISVQAAGGTMPIYIEKNKPDYELHRMLGETKENTYVPTNVGTGRTHPIAIYRGDPVPSDQASQIHIYVNNTQNGSNYQIAGKSPTDANGNTSSIEIPGNNSTLDGSTLTNKTVAPSAFTVPTSVKWMQELKTIHTEGYEQFPTWVADHTQAKDWYNNPKAGAPLVDLAQVEHGTGDFAPPTADGETNYDAAIEWRVLTPDPVSKTLAAKSKADSYLRIQGYGGSEEPVFSRLDDLGEDGRVTCTVVLSSNRLYNQAVYDERDEVDPTITATLQGIMVPANVAEDGTLTNQNTTFTVNSFTRFKDATYVPGHHEVGFTGQYTYTLEFSFSKANMVKSSTTVNEVTTYTYHDFLLLYLKGKDGETTTVTLGGGDASGVNGDVKVEKWYVHY